MVASLVTAEMVAREEEVDGVATLAQQTAYLVGMGIWEAKEGPVASLETVEMAAKEETMPTLQTLLRT